jgi:hypothetical protein
MAGQQRRYHRRGYAGGENSFVPSVIAGSLALARISVRTELGVGFMASARRPDEPAVARRLAVNAVAGVGRL